MRQELQKKIDWSIDLLRKSEKLARMYDPDNGFYLAFSGGKDSQALYHIAVLAGVPFKAHMNLTSVDPPEVIRFVKRQYPDVELIKPKDSIYNIAVQKGLLPSRKIRWCCEEFKENAGAGKVTLIGIRHAESTRRAKRNEVEVSSKAFSGTLEQFGEFREKRLKNNKVHKIVLPKPSVAHPEAVQSESVVGCITGKESILISPIIHWTEQDVWEFLNEVVKVPHCSLYDNGHKRIGCILCPMSNYKHKLRDIKEYPHAKRCWIKAIKTIRCGGGLIQHNYTNESSDQTPIYGRSYHRAFLGGPSGEDAGGADKEDIIAENIFDWWIGGKSYEKWYADKFLQQKLF